MAHPNYHHRLTFPNEVLTIDSFIMQYHRVDCTQLLAKATDGAHVQLE